MGSSRGIVGRRYSTSNNRHQAQYVKNIMLKLLINSSNSCAGIWHMAYKRNPHPFKQMYLLLTLHFCSSLCGPGVLDQGEIRKCLYYIPSPFASPCLYLPAVFIAPLDAGHLDQQDWITKKKRQYSNFRKYAHPSFLP